MPLLWMSFSVRGKNAGVIITEAKDVIEGAEKAHKLGINPGGQVLAFPVPEDSPEAKYPKDVLISSEEIEKLGKVTRIKNLPKGTKCAACGPEGHTH